MKKKALLVFFIIQVILFVGLDSCKDEYEVTQYVPAAFVKEAITGTDGLVSLEVNGQQIEVTAIDANTGDVIENIHFRVVVSDKYISVLGSDSEDRYLASLNGVIIEEGSKGIFGIIVRFVKCNILYYQEVISSFSTNTPEGIELLFAGGNFIHEEQTELGLIGDSFIKWAFWSTLDEIVTIIISIPTSGGALYVITKVVTIAELLELVFIEGLRTYYYALGYKSNDSFIQSNRVYSGPLGQGCIHHFLNMEPTGPPSGMPLTKGNLSFTVKDATTGLAVSDALVKIVPGSGNGKIYTSNSSGFVNAHSQIPGNHNITIEHTNFQSRFINDVIVESNGTNNLGDILLNPIGHGVRFVLSWGANPDDLDLHLWYIDGTNDEHFYFSHKGNDEVFPYIELDVDDTDSYGPETMTVAKLSSNASYIVAVHEFSEDSVLSTSGAVVNIYTDSQGQINHLEVPTGYVGESWWWYILSMDEFGNISIANSLNEDPPYSYKGMDFVKKK